MLETWSSFYLNPITHWTFSPTKASFPLHSPGWWPEGKAPKCVGNVHGLLSKRTITPHCADLLDGREEDRKVEHGNIKRCRYTVCLHTPHTYTKACVGHSGLKKTTGNGWIKASFDADSFRSSVRRIEKKIAHCYPKIHILHPSRIQEFSEFNDSISSFKNRSNLVPWVFFLLLKWI